MYLAKVIGTIWGAKQAPGLEGLKLLQVRPIRLKRASDGTEGDDRLTPEECDLSSKVLVAADTLGAGPGEYVLVSLGSRVRDIVYDSRLPIKAMVIAIVDSADINIGEVR